MNNKSQTKLKYDIYYCSGCDKGHLDGRHVVMKEWGDKEGRYIWRMRLLLGDGMYPYGPKHYPEKASGNSAWAARIIKHYNMKPRGESND